MFDGMGYNLIAEHMFGIYEDLGLIFSTKTIVIIISLKIKITSKYLIAHTLVVVAFRDKVSLCV